MHTPLHDVLTNSFTIALTSEFNVNYLSILSLITFFLPHLLDIGVSSISLQPYSLADDRKYYRNPADQPLLFLSLLVSL